MNRLDFHDFAIQDGCPAEPWNPLTGLLTVSLQIFMKISPKIDEKFDSKVFKRPLANFYHKFKTIFRLDLQHDYESSDVTFYFNHT